MKIHIVVHTPLGTFRSMEQEVTPAQKDELREWFKEALSYFEMTLDNGQVAVLSKEVCANSIFVIEQVEEDLTPEIKDLLDAGLPMPPW